MKTVFAILLAALCLGCGSKEPIDVYRDMLAAAEVGYEDGFVDGFSKRSQATVRALLRLSDAYGYSRENPLNIIMRPKTTDAVSQKIKGDVAIVRISRKKRRAQAVLFMKDKDSGGAWRVDLSEHEEFVKNKTFERYLKSREKREKKRKARKLKRKNRK
tara:strand:- start:185 stop:661 length:477 start_codon:yes stop_codon:yes gene_type:complete